MQNLFLFISYLSNLFMFRSLFRWWIVGRAFVTGYEMCYNMNDINWMMVMLRH